MKNRSNAPSVAPKSVQRFCLVTAVVTTATIQLHGFFSRVSRNVAKLSSTPILFHVLPPIHREILVARRSTRVREGAAKQGDGKSFFSCKTRGTKVYSPLSLSLFLSTFHSCLHAGIFPSRLFLFQFLSSRVALTRFKLRSPLTFPFYFPVRENGNVEDSWKSK